MARQKQKLPPLVLLTWLEHYSISPKGTYQGQKRLDRCDLTRPLLTAGWLVRKSKRHYYVATTLSTEADGSRQFTTVMAVLRSSVIRKERLD